MFKRIFVVVFICALCFCGLWFLAADAVTDSLHDRLKAENAKREALVKERNDLEKIIVRTRVQLNSLIEANSDLNDKMDELQKQVNAQEKEILRLKEIGTNAVGSSRASIDTICQRINRFKSRLASSELERRKQRDSIAFLIEYSRLLSDRVE
jgi:chromosome segregation ATPase